MNDLDLDLNIGKMQKFFLIEHNINFIKFECNILTNDKTDKTDIIYPICDDNNWCDYDKKFSSNINKLAIKGYQWYGCLCNPPNVDHKWISYYECDKGWNLERIMAAIRHNYLWGSIACYFTKNIWQYSRNLFGYNPNIRDLWCTYPMTFKNQIAEARYVSDVGIIENENNIIVKYYGYT